jgi:MFS family permease
VGILLGINRAVRIILNGPVGWVYDRLPRRILFVSALFAGALSTALYAVDGGFGVFLVGRLLRGLSWSFIWVGGTSIILDVTNDKDRGYWMGFYQVWFFLGASVGALAGGILTDLIGYTATMWASSLLTAIGGMVALIFLPETRRSHPASQAEHALNIPPKLKFKTGLASTISVYGVNRFVTNGILLATLGLLVQERMGNQYLAFGVASVTGALSAGRNSVSMFSSVASGKISDWLGDRWNIILWSLALGEVGMAILAWNRPVALLVGVLLAAIVGGCMQTILVAL